MEFKVNDFNFDPEIKVLSINSESGDTAEIKVKHLIPISEMVSLIEECVESMYIQDNDGVVFYNPHLKEYTRRCLILKYFTDVNFSANDDSTYSFVHSDIFMDIEGAIDAEQLYEISDGIASLSKAKRDDLISKHKDELEHIISTMNEYTEMLSGLSGVMNSIDSEEFTDIIKKLSLIDNNAIVDGIIRQNRSEAKGE